MADLDFPSAASSPWTDPNGAVWTHDGDGWSKTATINNLGGEILGSVS